MKVARECDLFHFLSAARSSVLEERGQRESKEDEREESRVEEASFVDREMEKREQMRRESRGREIFQVTTGGDNMRSRGKGGGGLQGARESNEVMVRHREQDNGEGQGTAGPCEDKVELVPALWEGGKGQSVRSNVVKKLVKLVQLLWLDVEVTQDSGVPSSGKQLRRAPISSRKLQKGPGGR